MVKILTSILLSVCIFTTNAQVTSASMSGKITTISGETLLRAAIIATHEPTGTKYSVICDDSGVFYIENMRTGGPYNVKSFLIGYQEGVQWWI